MHIAAQHAFTERRHKRLIILIMLHTLCLHPWYRAVNHHHLLPIHHLQASKSLSDFNQWEKPKILFLWPVSLLHFLLLHLYTKNEPLVFKSMTSGTDVLSIISHALHYFYSVREVVNWDPWAQISFIKALRAFLPPHCSLIHSHINLWLLAFTHFVFFPQNWICTKLH